MIRCPLITYEISTAERNVTFDIIFTLICVTSLIVMINFENIKKYFISKLVLEVTKQSYTEEVIKDRLLVITFERNGESVIVPYNEDLIFDPQVVTINGKVYNIRRGVDVSDVEGIEGINNEI